MPDPLTSQERQWGTPVLALCCGEVWDLLLNDSSLLQSAGTLIPGSSGREQSHTSSALWEYEILGASFLPCAARSESEM